MTERTQPAESDAAVVARIRRAEAAADKSSWEVADGYLELRRRGWTGRRIAGEFQKSESHVSRFLACASDFALGQTRPPFWDAYQQVKHPQHEQHEKRRQQLAASVTSLHPDIRRGDFRELLADVPDNSVSLIFTDPPYNAASFPLYGDLARHAARILKPGGSLIAYAPNQGIIDVGMLMRPHLKFWCHLTLQLTGLSKAFPGRQVAIRHKPLLWFIKGERRANDTYIVDLLHSESPDKSLHNWAQSETEAAYLIDKLTEPGELILDPMCGSGTTLAAALKLGRRALGIEIDEERAKVATARLEGVVPLARAG
jgi:site-specific DNA-methyltransferase (adenine-specific)